MCFFQFPNAISFLSIKVKLKIIRSNNKSVFYRKKLDGNNVWILIMYNNVNTVLVCRKCCYGAAAVQAGYLK